MAVNEKLMALAQQKMFVYAKPSEAVKAAAKELNITLSAAEEQEILSSLNGGANWGKFDEYAFDPSKAQEYKDNLPEATKQNELAQARKRNAAKQAIAEQFKATEEAQKELDKSREELKRSIVEKRQQGFTGYLSAMKDRVKLDMMPSKVGEQLAGGTAVRFLGAAAFAAVAVAFTSCEKDDQVSVPINVSQNATVPITVSSKDYSSDIQAIRDELKNIKGSLTNIEQKVANQYEAILAKMENMINIIKKGQEVTQKDFEQLLKDINAWLETIEKNQVSFQTNTNTNFETLFDLIKSIANSTALDANAKFNKLMELLTQIKSIGESIDAKLTKMLGNDDVIIAALNKLDKNDEKTNSLLTSIYNAINSLGSNFAEYFKTIIVELSNGNASLDDIKKLLNAINKNVEDIKALVTKYGDKGVEIGNAIINAIKNVGGADLSAIEALLKQLVDGQKVTNNGIINLTDLFNKYSEGVNNKLNTIISLLKNMPNYDAKLTAILNAIGGIKPGGTAKDYEAQLNKIIELLEKLDKNNEVRNQKVLDAISKLGANLSSSLTAILNKIGQGGQEGQDYSSVLNAILAKLGDIDANNEVNFNRVIEALGKLSVGETKDVNLQPILDKLDEILKAIKDHKVTVDVTGKVTCECNCGNGGTHEGILGDLNALLG